MYKGFESLKCNSDQTGYPEVLKEENFHRPLKYKS